MNREDDMNIALRIADRMAESGNYNPDVLSWRVRLHNRLIRFGCRRRW